MIFVRPSIRLFGTDVHCDHAMHVSADLSSWLDSPSSGHLDTKACPPTPSHLFPVSPEREVGVWMCELGAISQERLKIEVKLLLSANRKSIATTMDDL